MAETNTTEIAATFGENRQWPLIAPKELGEMDLIQSAMASERKLVRTLYEGTMAMRAAGHEYLPQEPGETNPAWEHRRDRTFLFNAIKRTTHVLTGKPFTRPITIGSDVPERMIPWVENIDNTGRHLNVFARDLFQDAILDGIAYFLVDLQAAPRDETGKVIRLRRDQEAAREMRPYWVQFCADDVLGVHYELRNGKPFLTQVRLAIEEPYLVSDFVQEMQKAVMVLVPGGWAKYVPKRDEQGKASADGDYALEDAGPTSLDYIPFVPVYTGRVAFFVASPPLDDLGWLNLAHWQSSSDQAHILHIARVPILFAKNLELAPGEKLELGPNRLIRSEGSDAEIKYIEIQGASIEAGDKDLQRREDQMGHMAMQLLVPRQTDPTARQVGIEAAEAHSWLQAQAEGLQDSLEQGLAMTADVAGITQGGGSIEVYKDFWISGKDVQVGTLLSTAEQKGQISRDRFWKEWKRRDFLGQDFDPDDEKQQLEDESAEAMERMPAPFAQPGEDFNPEAPSVEGTPVADTEEATPEATE